MSSPRQREIALPPPPSAPVEEGGDPQAEESSAPASQAQIRELLSDNVCSVYDR